MEKVSINDNSYIAFKYGVIRLTRDKSGNVIPMGEEIVVPFIYDELKNGNLNTIIGAYNFNYNDSYFNKYTYIDVDPSSENYGKQLVPVVLEHAEPFGVGEDKLEDNFACCNVFYSSKEEVKPRYIPRNFCPVDRLSDEDLLSEEEMIIVKELYNPNSKSAIKRILKIAKF